MRKEDADMLEEIYKDVKELKQLHTISHDIHVEHHEFLSQLIENQKQNTRVKQALYEKLVISGIWGALGVLGVLLWLGFTEWLRING